MRLLLDTHVMLWWLRDNPKLGSRSRAAISDRTTRPEVSIASFWELSIKARKQVSGEIGSNLIEEATAAGLGILEVRRSHLHALEQLERVPGHNDPFDHLILAQAIAEGVPLMTSDHDMKRYRAPLFR